MLQAKANAVGNLLGNELLTFHSKQLVFMVAIPLIKPNISH